MVSTSLGVELEMAVADRKAVLALNVILAASPAFIALFANSPFENGEYSGYRENRLTLWPRMFRHARFAADDRLHRLPGRAFADLRDYFEWMFGEGSTMQLASIHLSAACVEDRAQRRGSGADRV